jgi:hypothetical protein
MKEIVLKNWNFVRFLRLGLGIVILVQAVMSRDGFMGMAGFAFSLLAVFNVGCFGGTCSVPQHSNLNQKNKSDEVEFEEVV